MNDTVIVAVLSLAGTLFGSLAGIITSGKLTNYRIAELERRVESLGSLIERTYALERREQVSEEKLRSIEQRVHSLEKTSNQANIH